MQPLGDDWDGICRAKPERPWKPEDAALHPLCNRGYARGVCSCFPDDSGGDAVRFTVSRDDGASIAMYFVVECDHHPFAHGPLEYSLATDSWTGAPENEILLHQAQAYLRSYLRRKSEATRR